MSVLQNKLLTVKLISNKQRGRQRGKTVVNSSRFTHFICHNGSEDFVPVWSTRRVFADVPLRLNVGLLFYTVFVAKQCYFCRYIHIITEHNTKTFLFCASLYFALKTSFKREDVHIYQVYT